MGCTTAASVRGPKYVITKGKTPVLSADEARELIFSIETATVKGLRDRALLAVLVNTFARVGAVIKIRVEDYFQQGKRWWFRFYEKSGKLHEVPAHDKAEAHVDAWMDASGIAEEANLPLFRTFGRNGEVTARLLFRPMFSEWGRSVEVEAVCRNRLAVTPFGRLASRPSLENGGTIEKAQALRPVCSENHKRFLDNDSLQHDSCSDCG